MGKLYIPSIFIWSLMSASTLQWYFLVFSKKSF